MKNHFSFSGRVGVLATMHHKEKVMAPRTRNKPLPSALEPSTFCYKTPSCHPNVPPATFQDN